MGHPTVNEGRVNRRVCFSYSNSCECSFYSRISVRNCGTYFVYHLEKPPIAEAKYCGSPPGSKSIVNDMMKPRFKPQNICNISKTILHPDRLWSNTNPALSKCDSDLYG